MTDLEIVELAALRARDRARGNGDAEAANAFDTFATELYHLKQQHRPDTLPPQNQPQ